MVGVIEGGGRREVGCPEHGKQKLGSRGDFTKGVEPLEFWL